RGADLDVPDGRPGPDELRELDQGLLTLADLVLGALQDDVVSAGDDLDVELRLEGLEVVVVPPQEMAEVDVLGEGDTARDRGGVAQFRPPRIRPPAGRPARRSRCRVRGAGRGWRGRAP